MKETIIYHGGRLAVIDTKHLNDFLDIEQESELEVMTLISEYTRIAIDFSHDENPTNSSYSLAHKVMVDKYKQK